MPVQFDQYDPENGSIRAGSNAGQILRFLAQSPESGFAPREIANHLGLAKGSVGPTLQRLEERGLVRHKEPFWAIGIDPKEVTRLIQVENAYEQMETRYGSEDFESAKESAVDPREMRE